MPKSLLHIVWGIAILILPFFVNSQEPDSLSTIQELNSVTIQGARQQKVEPSLIIQESTDNLMNAIPKLSLIKRGNYALEPTIRGMQAGQITTTIDGMQMFGACTDRMDPISSYVEPTNLEEIQLSSASDSKQTGSSTGGGINFSMLKAKIGADRKWSGRVGVGYETNAQFFQGLGALQYSGKRWAFLVNGVYKKADNYYAARRKEIKYSQFEKWNARASLSFQLNENHLLYLDYLQDEGYNIGYPALTMDVGYAKAYVSALTHVYSNSNRIMRKVETKFFFNYIDHTMDDTKRPKEEVPMHMDMPGISRTFGMYSNALFVLGEKHMLNAKVNTFQNFLHAEMTMYPDKGSEMFMLTIPDAQRQTLGVSINDVWRISQKWKLTVGGRIETNNSQITTELGRQTLTSFYEGEANKTRLSGNVSVKVDYQLNKNVSFYLESNYAQRPPSLQELYGFYLFNRMDNYDYIGNPNNLNEKSVGGNIGATWRYKKVSISLEGFVNHLSDYITGIFMEGYSGMAFGSSGVKQYQNIQSALLTGGEFVFQWKIIEQLHFQTINSYVYGIDFENNYLPTIPPFRSRNSLEYDLKGYHITVEYVGALAQNNVSEKRYGETRTPGYSLFNISFHKHFELKNNQGIHARLEFENIFDTPYYEHLDVMKIQRQGFNAVMRVTWEF